MTLVKKKKPALYWFLRRENQAMLLSAEHGAANEYVATCVLFTFDKIRSWFYYRVKMRIERIVFSVLIYHSKHMMRLEAVKMWGIGPRDLTGIIAWYQRSERQFNNMTALIRPLESYRNKSNVRRLSNASTRQVWVFSLVLTRCFPLLYFQIQGNWNDEVPDQL